MYFSFYCYGYLINIYLSNCLSSIYLNMYSDNQFDYQPLTPNHLLHLQTSTGLSPGIFSKDDLVRRQAWRQAQYLAGIQYFGVAGRESISLRYYSGKSGMRRKEIFNWVIWSWWRMKSIQEERSRFFEPLSHYWKRWFGPFIQSEDDINRCCMFERKGERRNDCEYSYSHTSNCTVVSVGDGWRRYWR